MRSKVAHHNTSPSALQHRPSTAIPHLSLIAFAVLLTAEGEGDFFFDAESLQVAPGVDLQALLSGAGEMEHTGEEEGNEDEVEEGEEGEEWEERAGS